MRAKRLPLKAIGLRRALDLMHLHGTSLVRMATNDSPLGYAHYVIPGGYVEPDTAEKIKAHPAVVPGGDGLFPRHDQTWRIGS